MPEAIAFFQELKAIEAVIRGYCDGLYTGNTEQLRAVFHPQAHLQAPGLRLTLEQWLSKVTAREKPKAEQAQQFNVQAVEILAEQAVVKLSCPLFHHQYTDFLSLLKEDGQWLIVNKMYCDTPSIPTNRI